MKLLVACPHRVLLVDAETRDVSVVEDQRREYYGITWTLDGQQLCLSHSCVNNSQIQTFEDYIDSERGYVSIGSLQAVDCLSAPHQIFADQERLFITNTGRNCLTVARLSDGMFRHVWLAEQRWDRWGERQRKGQHFNSVFLSGDHLMVLAHNFDRPSFLVELAYPSLDVLRRIPLQAGQAHNIWHTEGQQWIVCDSMRSRLVAAETGEPLWTSANSRHITRGLAAAGQQVFVGVSQKTTRLGRVHSDGGVFVLDRETFQELDFIPLPYAGSVHEVRVIDAPDDCHHGHPLLNLPTLDDAANGRYQRMLKGRRATHGPYIYFEPRPLTVALGELRQRAQGLRLVTDELTVALHTDSPLADVAVEAVIDLSEANDDAHAGLVARYCGPDDNEMLCAIVQRTSQETLAAGLWRNQHCEWSRLCGTSVSSGKYRWRLECRGDELKLFCDGKELLTAHSAEVTCAGLAGVRGTGGIFEQFTAEALTALASAVAVPQLLEDRKAA